MVLAGNSVGLALMHVEDVPTIVRWHQTLEFTARMGTPGEVHTLEMRWKFYDVTARIRPDSAAFTGIELGTGRLVGFGGLFDITRAMAATLFVGIGEAADRNKGRGTEASQLLCEYGFFFRGFLNIKVEVHGYNVAARCASARLGFKIAGRSWGTNLLDTRRYDEVIWDLVHSEF